MTATTLIVCSRDGPCVPTHHSIVRLVKEYPDWDELVAGEQGINRARSACVSQWYRENVDEDVFVMLDDDILFQPKDAVKLANLCRNGHDVIAAAYPFRDASSIVVRPLPGDTSLTFGSDVPPHEVLHVGTGFLAVHRKVISAMIPTLKMVSSRLSRESMWPFFEDKIIEDSEAATGYNWLTEDFGFMFKVRELGFKIWLDPSIFLAHYGQVPVTLTNMKMVNEAIKSTFS